MFWRLMGSHCLAEELCFPETIQFIYLSSFAAPMERTLVTLSIFSPAIKSHRPAVLKLELLHPLSCF